jgi:hypothetical protein
MKRTIAIAVLALCSLAGCRHRELARPKQEPSAPTFSQFHNDNHSWNTVSRVIVLPLLNESPYTRADDEVGRALTAELQQLGRFEVVAGAPDDLARLSAKIHRGGRFNEVDMLEIARATNADIVLHGTITHYSPYPRPRLGLILQAVKPTDGKVVASVDGLWDSTRFDVADRVRAYYRRSPKRPAFIANHRIEDDDSYSGDLALDSPHLFQRYVCAEAIQNMVLDNAALAEMLKLSSPNGKTCDKCSKTP